MPGQFKIPFDTLRPGLPFLPTVIDRLGAAWAAPQFAWKSSAPEVVTITSDGEGRARAPGKATLSAVAREPGLGDRASASVEVVVEG